MERFAAFALQQSVQMHVGTKSFRETWTVCFAQGSDARPTVLVADFPAFVATPTIESYSGTPFSH